MTRRPDRLGSVYQRRDGRWVAAVAIDGKRISRYARTEAEAWALLGELLPRPEPEEQPALRVWIDRWLHLKHGELRPSSRTTYRKYLAIIAATELGSRRLGELTPLDFVAFFSDAIQAGRSLYTLAALHGILRHCLSDAVAYDLLDANPLLRVRRPRWERRVIIYWTIPQALAFIGVAARARSRRATLLILLATCGLRIGEALALDWREVDLGSRQLRVVLTAQRIDKVWVFGPPKTATGWRVVAMPHTAVAALQKLGPQAEGPVFWVKDGSHPFLREDVETVLRRLCVKAGVPYLHPHGLRHVAAALAQEATKDVHAVQRRLGHSNVRLTVDTYLHPTHTDAEVAGGIDDLLS